MTRGGASASDGDLHARFASWLQAGAAGDPPRDAAVHAAHCLRCRAEMLALDHLLAIDLGRAPLPPSRASAPLPHRAILHPRRVAAGAIALVLIAGVTWVGIGALAPGLVGGPATPSTDQGVLGGFGAGGSLTPGASASFGGVEGTETADPGTGTAEPSAGATAAPPGVTTPAPTAIGPAPTPPPSVGQSVAPSAQPTRTAAPTATPTPVPTPEPSSLPLPQCADGLDNDGDGAIDFASTNPDPQCETALDDDESA
jgi:hypothetical protein